MLMSRPILLRVLIPLGVIVLAEVLLRMGVWESMAEPSSRIGATVALKQRVLADAEPVQIVTLGNSRVEYGLDHALLAETAARHGKRHVLASLRGANWLTWTSLASWLKQRRPELDNALIAVSVADLFWENNGSYEIRMVEPFRTGLWPPPEARALFDRQDSNTYAVYSALFAYRADLADYVRDPAARHRVLRLQSEPKVPPGQSIERNLCAIPSSSLASCAAHAVTDLRHVDIVTECQQSLAAAQSREDWRVLNPAIAREREAVRALRQQQLGEMPFRRPLVVLMPVLRLWRNEVYPNGYEPWVQQVLAPLVAAGRIDLIDATTFFDLNAGGECAAFVDLYHQNPSSAHALTVALLPQIETSLYLDREHSR